MGATLLCGLLSFKTIEEEKSQRIIQKVVVESNLSGCNCFLRVVDGSNGTWVLYLDNDCSKHVKASFTYYVYHLNGDIVPHPVTETEYEPGRNFIDHGVKSKTLCCPGTITACLIDEEPTMPRK